MISSAWRTAERRGDRQQQGSGLACCALAGKGGALPPLRGGPIPGDSLAFPLAIGGSVTGLPIAIFITWLTRSRLLRYGILPVHRIALLLVLGLVGVDSTVCFLRATLYGVHKLPM